MILFQYGRLSEDALKLAENLHRVLCAEKRKGGLSISVDRILDRMRSYLGLPRSSVFKIIKNKVRSGGSSKQMVQFKPRGRPAALDSFDRALIERTVHKMYDQKIAPTVDKIKTELSETLTISKTKFLNGKISFIKRYLPPNNLCYLPYCYRRKNELTSMAPYRQIGTR